MEQVQFLGLECVRLANSSLSLLVTRSLGPRIIALQLRNGPNLFAQLPDFKLECPGYGQLTLWGGHRLWHAPEKAQRTYLPDMQPPEIRSFSNGLAITQPVEEETGIQKSIVVRFSGEEPTVIVDHALTNHGAWPIELAPWAITQLAPGGTAILPQNSSPDDPDGLLPNRQLALWPYSDLGSSHIGWASKFIFVSATMKEGAFKIGFPNPDGWLAYHNKNTLFVKKAIFHPWASYYDYGSSSECYCNDRFLELETLGPKTMIAPGESVEHREVWQVFENIDFSPTEGAAMVLVDQLGLSDYRAEELQA